MYNDILIKIKDVPSYKILKRLNEKNFNIIKIIYNLDVSYLSVYADDYQKIFI